MTDKPIKVFSHFDTYFLFTGFDKGWSPPLEAKILTEISEAGYELWHDVFNVANRLTLAPSN